jgi:hypothetical protein
MSGAHTRWLGAATVAALAFGCSDQLGHDHDPIGDGSDVTHPDGGRPDGHPPVTCGAPTTFDLPVGAGSIGLQTDLAVDAAGNVFYANGSSITKFSGDGGVVYTHPYGAVVAVDTAGNAYVAGAFSAPIDFGFGPMTPDGNVDTFLVKLNMDGQPLFARQLHLCGDGVRSIAVAMDGRIAVSGPAMGTVVLDASGNNVLLSFDFSGAVAFDSVGDLIVAGEFTALLDLAPDQRYANGGEGDAFIAKIDASGFVMFSRIIGDPPLPVTLFGGLEVRTASRQLAAAVSVDANDNIIVLGRFDLAADVFGDTYKALSIHTPDAADSIHSGAFLVKLDAAGDVMVKTSISDVASLGDLAVDAKGNMFVNGATYIDSAPPFRSTFLIKLNAAAQLIGGGGTNTPGAGHSLAVDMCGNLFESLSERFGSPLVPFEAHLTKSQQ